MKDIIEINYSSEQPTILGRDLHKALKIKTEYANMKAFEAWEAMDAIMEILKQTYPKLYNYALIEIKKIK